MNVLLKCWKFIRRHVNKYQIAFIVFLVMIFFVHELNLTQYIKNKRTINELKTEKQELEHRRDSSMQQTDDLLRPESDQAEQIAREKYRMKKSDEDVFVIQKKEKKEEKEKKDE